MTVISAKAFAENLTHYLHLAQKEEVVVKLGSTLFEITPKNPVKKYSKAEQEYLDSIPEEFRCDPFAVSPSGDPYWADRRNVEELERRTKEAEEGNAELIELTPEYRKRLFSL